MAKNEETWEVALPDGRLAIGVRQSLLDSLGELASMEVPEAGTRVQGGGTLAVLEGVKTVYELPAPCNCVVEAQGDMAKVQEYPEVEPLATVRKI